MTGHRNDDETGFRRIGEILGASGELRLDRLNEAHARALDEMERTADERPRAPITRGIE